MIHVLVWNEFRHEKSEEVRKIYPIGIHGAIAEKLSKYPGFEIKTATLDDHECGLTDQMLDWADVIIWWGHCAHAEVPDAIADKVVKAVWGGKGFIALHSAHRSKPFVKLMGTGCSLLWRVDGEKERVWVVEPGHAIARNLPPYIEFEHEEMYGERFDIPAPDELVFISWFAGGEVFRSGCCYKRGSGKIFYFRPGHEEYPTFYRDDVAQIISNAIEWAQPSNGPVIQYGFHEALDK